jgi:hypothetical protein
VITSSGDVNFTMFMVLPPSLALATGFTACVIA